MKNENTFRVGQHYKIYKDVARDTVKKDWVRATVVGVPSHGRFVRFKMHFITIFGEKRNYIESFSMSELESLMRSGNLLKG